MLRQQNNASAGETSASEWGKRREEETAAETVVDMDGQWATVIWQTRRNHRPDDFYEQIYHGVALLLFKQYEEKAVIPEKY